MLRPKHRWVSTEEATSDLQDLDATEVACTRPIDTAKKWHAKTLPGRSFRDAVLKYEGRDSFFNYRRLDDRIPACTLPADHGKIYHWSECRQLTFREWKRLGSFPDDYHARSERIGKYMIGMSVPPKMAEHVARQVAEQWLGADSGLVV